MRFHSVVATHLVNLLGVFPLILDLRHVASQNDILAQSGSHVHSDHKAFSVSEWPTPGYYNEGFLAAH